MWANLWRRSTGVNLHNFWGVMTFPVVCIASGRQSGLADHSADVTKPINSKSTFFDLLQIYSVASWQETRGGAAPLNFSLLENFLKNIQKCGFTNSEFWGNIRQN